MSLNLRNNNNLDFRVMSTESYLEDSKKVLNRCIDLMSKKNKDYQGGSVCDEDYYPHGWKSFDTMMSTKILRFRSVMEQDGDVNFDSAEDCLIDLINYASRCIVWLERKNPNSGLCPICGQDSLSYDDPNDNTLEEPFCHECDIFPHSGEKPEGIL